VDIVDRNGRSTGLQGRDGGIAQPDRLFDQGARAVVFAQQVAGFVVGVEDRAGGASADVDSLDEGVVNRSFRGGAIGQGFESSGVVVGGGNARIPGGVAGGVVAIRAGEGARDGGDPVACG
jgi:hypothetical protein